MKLKHLAAAATLAVAGIAAPALAQNAPVTVGAAVFGPDGNQVGTVDKLEGGNAVVNSGAASAALPIDKFGKGAKGLTIGFTKEQFEAAVNGANAKSAEALSAALVAGADLYSADGVLLGKVKTVGEDGNVVVDLPTGAFTVKKEQVAMNGDKLTFRATKADVDAAIANAKAG
jgi:hypothetical protein